MTDSSSHIVDSGIAQSVDGGATSGVAALPLTESVDNVEWPAGHYAAVERAGPIMESARAAWTELHRLVPAIEEHNRIVHYVSQYHTAPSPVYRATVMLDRAPQALPDGLIAVEHPGDRFRKFRLIGPYDLLPQACGRVDELLQKRHKRRRNTDWTFEHYVNSPHTTPPQQLITDILVPTVDN